MLIKTKLCVISGAILGIGAFALQSAGDAKAEYPERTVEGGSRDRQDQYHVTLQNPTNQRVPTLSKICKVETNSAF